MKLSFRVAGFVALAAVANPAMAAPGWIVQPVQVGQQTVRYVQGEATIDQEQRDGIVQITPLDFDHGSPSFGIAVYNDTWKPANFDVTNIRVWLNGEPVRVFTQQDLAKKAKSRAFWRSMAIAAVSGVASGLAASQTSTYNYSSSYASVSKFGASYGVSHGSIQGPSLAGQIQAANIQQSGVDAMYGVQGRLDRTLAELKDNIVQLSTVDPGETYGGRIVIDKIAPTAFPSRIDVAMEWNGETYNFAFQAAKPGTPAPAFAAIDRKSDLTNFRAGVTPGIPGRPVNAELPAVAPAVYAPQPDAQQPYPRQMQTAYAQPAYTQPARPAATPSRGGLVRSSSASKAPASGQSNSWGLVPVSR